MKYELVSTYYGIETKIDDDSYYITITLGIQPTDGIAPLFSKDIEVMSNNDQTGYEVDFQRKVEINNYISLIND